MCEGGLGTANQFRRAIAHHTYIDQAIRARDLGSAEAAFFDKHGLALPLSIYAPVGCEACNRSGYAGRVGIFEMLEVTEDLRAAIDRGVSETELRHMALDARETLVGQGLGEVAAGRTSLAETLRVVGDVA